MLGRDKVLTALVAVAFQSLEKLEDTAILELTWVPFLTVNVDRNSGVVLNDATVALPVNETLVGNEVFVELESGTTEVNDTKGVEI